MSSAPWLDGPADCFPNSYLLACPATQQYQRLSSYYCDIEEFFSQSSGRDDRWFWHAFAKPIKETKREQCYCLNSNANVARPSTLEQLPNELVDAVLAALIEDDDMASVIAFGLASPILYPKVLSRIHRDYATQNVAPWAGNKVGFLGGDSPVDPSLVDANADDFFEYITFAVEPWPTREKYEEASMSAEKVWREALGEVWSQGEEMEESTWEYVAKDLSSDYLFPTDRVWVLRNLTTRQCVRDDGLVPPDEILEDELLLDEVGKKYLLNGGSGTYDPLKPGEDLLRAQALEAFTLPQVFLVLTAHSGHPGWREEDVGFSHGPCVNHTFEVVPLEEHGKTAEWEDVTAEVAADVGYLRWCVMQRAALIRAGAQNDGSNTWRRASEFRERALKARAKWTAWAKREKDRT